MANVNKVQPVDGAGNVKKQVYVETHSSSGVDVVAWCLIAMQGVTILLWGLFVEFDNSASPLTTMSMPD
jgi:hypothetical protein